MRHGIVIVKTYSQRNADFIIRTLYSFVSFSIVACTRDSCVHRHQPTLSDRPFSPHYLHTKTYKRALSQ